MKMNKEIALRTGAISGALSVIIGAFGAHALKGILMGTGRADTFELAVRYQFYHTLAILFAGMLMQHYTAATLRYAVFLFTTGVALFSGSLYGLSLTGLTFLGMITPLGGLAFIAGWICLLLAVSKKQASLV